MTGISSNGRRLARSWYIMDYAVKTLTAAQALEIQNLLNERLRPQGKPEVTIDPVNATTLLARCYDLNTRGTFERLTYEDHLMLRRSVNLTEWIPTFVNPSIVRVSSLSSVDLLPGGAPGIGQDQPNIQNAATIGMAFAIVALVVGGLCFVGAVALCGRIQLRRLEKAEKERAEAEQAKAAENMRDNFDMVKTRISIMLPKFEHMPEQDAYGPPLPRLDDEDSDDNLGDDIMPQERTPADLGSASAGLSPMAAAGEEHYTLDMSSEGGTPQRRTINPDDAIGLEPIRGSNKPQASMTNMDRSNMVPMTPGAGSRKGRPKASPRAIDDELELDAIPDDDDELPGIHGTAVPPTSLHGAAAPPTDQLDFLDAFDVDDDDELPGIRRTSSVARGLTAKGPSPSRRGGATRSPSPDDQFWTAPEEGSEMPTLRGQGQRAAIVDRGAGVGFLETPERGHGPTALLRGAAGGSGGGGRFAFSPASRDSPAPPSSANSERPAMRPTTVPVGTMDGMQPIEEGWNDGSPIFDDPLEAPTDALTGLRANELVGDSPPPAWEAGTPYGDDLT